MCEPAYNGNTKSTQPTQVATRIKYNVVEIGDIPDTITNGKLGISPNSSVVCRQYI